MIKTQENTDTEITEKFMETFNINNCDIGTKRQCGKYNSFECYYCDNKYPEITAEKLLEMIIIRATNYKSGTIIELEPDSNIEDLKYEVLRHFIDYRGNFDKHQIQQLFKE